MTFPDNPFLIFLLIILSLVSFVFTWAGIKARRPVWVLYGVGAGIPPMDIANLTYWLVGLLCVGAGYWLSKRI